MKLLQKAKKYHAKTLKRQTITAEHVELALAYINETLALAQIAHALDERIGGQKVYTTMCRALKRAYAEGKIKII